MFKDNSFFMTPDDAPAAVSISAVENLYAFEDAAYVKICMMPGCEDLLPEKAHNDDAGFDLYASVATRINPDQIALIPTGVRLAMDYKDSHIPGTGQKIRNWIMSADVRNQIDVVMEKHLMVFNSPGTINQSYRGEIKVLLYNTSDKIQWIKRGDRIAQLVFICTPIVYFEQITEETFNETEAVSDRGSGGFGSTGIETNGK